MAQPKQKQHCVATAGCVNADVDDGCNKKCAIENAVVHVLAM